MIDGEGWYFTPGLNGWTPPIKDIAPGDRVSATGGGYAISVGQIGQITGAVDLVADTIEGTVNAPGFVDPLYVKCEVWTKNGSSGVGVTVQSAGGRYLCDFHPVGQLAVGQMIAVRYIQLDGNAVIDNFLAYDHALYLPLVRR